VLEAKTTKKAFIGESKAINSSDINGLARVEAIQKMGQILVDRKVAEIKTYYRLRD
jgi:hypothetical protein